MFQRPLLEHIVAAMSALFDLDNDDSDLLDNALLRHVGPWQSWLPSRRLPDDPFIC
jgi:hypothetical protein